MRQKLPFHASTFYIRLEVMLGTGTGRQPDQFTRLQEQAECCQILKRLVELNFVYQAEKRGRSVYYETSPDVALIAPEHSNR